MFFKVGNKFVRTLNAKRKRNLVALSVLSTSIIFGYLSFLACWLSGFMIAKYLGSKEAGKRSKLPSIRLPLGKYRIHLHHWLISSAVMVLALLRGPWFFPSDLFYGFLGGIAFQGIYCYGDWHRILIVRQGKSPAATTT